MLVSGVHPIRAKKARYYEDARLKPRVMPPVRRSKGTLRSDSRARSRDGNDSVVRQAEANAVAARQAVGAQSLYGLRLEPELSSQDPVKQPQAADEVEIPAPEPDDTAARALTLARTARATARQAAMDPDDGIAL